MASLYCRTQKLITWKSTLALSELNLYFFRSLSATHEGIQAFNSEITDLDQEERTRTEKLRNVSGLPANIYKQYHGEPPDLPYKDLYKRKMLYARFGMASGEDARILWPSRKKILDQEEEEKEEGRPLSERLAQLKLETEEANNAVIERRKVIAKNMAQMPKWIQEYKKKQEIAESEAKARAAKKEEFLLEAYDHFGYKIHANDPKFKQMLEDREAKEKSEAKKRKKEEKKKKLLLSLQSEVPKTKSEGSS